VDFTAIISDCWRLIRTTRPLWWLATISAIQLALYATIVGIIIVPMTVLTQMAVIARQQASSGRADPVQLDVMVVGAVHWLGANWAMLAASAVTLLAIWAVSGVFDVAATAGAITQADAVAGGKPASAAAGLHDGFRIWWRTIGLLAIAALPALLYLLLLAVVTFYTTSLPLYRGELPDLSAMRVGNVMSTPVSVLVSLVSIPLNVIVALGLRFAALGGMEWRESFGRGWALLKARFVDVAVWYLIVIGFGAAISFVGMVPISIVLIVGAMVVLATGAIHVGGAGLAAIGAVAGVGCAVLMALVILVTLLWQSVAWTMFWRELTGTSAVELTQEPVQGEVWLRPAAAPANIEGGSA
jgi:hypothetical protein